MKENNKPDRTDWDNPECRMESDVFKESKWEKSIDKLFPMH